MDSTYYLVDRVSFRLSKSKFRSSFHLSEEDKKYVGEKGMNALREHARAILKQRIGRKPDNDGRQTPWKGHPVFVAMHANALCCRDCLKKWYGVEEFVDLTPADIEKFSGVIVKWIEKELN